MAHRMFEDIESATTEAVLTQDSNDRNIVYAIWAKSDAMPISEAWRILQARYPDEPRFLLMHTYEELRAAHGADAWTPSAFLETVKRILDTAGGRLNPEVRDLVAIAEDHLHPLSEEDAARLDRIRMRVSAKAGDPVSADRRLSRFRLDFVRELHERTSGDQRIGPPPSGSLRAPPGDWKSTLSAAKGAKSTYSPTAKVKVGDVVEHPKFGAGVVTAIEPGRAQILFESGARKLVCG